MAPNSKATHTDHGQSCYDPITQEVNFCWSKLRQDPIYTGIYTLLTDIVVRILLPLSVMMWTNLSIYRTMKSTDSCNQRESQVIAMLFGVAIPLLICHSYR